MKNNWSLAICLLLVCATLGSMAFLNPQHQSFLTASNDKLLETASSSSTLIPTSAPTAPAATPTNAEIAQVYGKLPLSFEQNTGQTDSAVDYIARGAGYSLFLKPTEAVFVLSHQFDQHRKNIDLVDPQSHGGKKQSRSLAAGHRALLRMKLAGANSEAEVQGEQEQAGTVNYFIGDDKSQWRSGIATFGRVNYKSVYPGVDVAYYGNQQQLEYDFIVQPGADYRQIKLRFEGAEKVEIERETGDLLLQTRAGGVVREHRPKVYQEVINNPEDGRKEVAGRYVKRGKEIEFEVGQYDRKLPLVIDPTLAYSTYLGGSGNDLGYGIAVDSSGNAYVTGETDSTDFPTINPTQPTASVDFDAFVTKFNAAGTALVYSTYLGGNGKDIGYGIAVDSDGNAYLTGQTYSTDFSTVNPIQSRYGGTGDAFVTKINAAGTALIYSTYLGGSGVDYDFGSDSGLSIAVDSSGDAYLTGYTTSTNFPTANPMQPIYGGGRYDAFVTKINAAGTALVYSTYLGGSGLDSGTGVAADS